MTKLSFAVAALVASVGIGAATAATHPIAGVQAHSSRYGKVLFDRRGFVLYAFTADARGKSNCRGDCAVRWPPLLTGGPALALAGVDRTKLGTLRRANGATQVTYAGRPLYHYVGDVKPGQILCQAVTEFGGEWLVVRPSGVPVR